ncbi:serine/threonine-protein kinase [Rubrivirga sp. S365]|uniref:serine/threonine-protein kinase n=1 Tax=Rubrivirga sp. S365 TaxID=3076080 RepID=UPI0028C76A5C|nr:serine/threonine-protein kinase [Rubrivirga sp. S365]MDT7858067.1 serine/threonine-protein kinase [Rubrivirga sp. S365]
MAGAADWVSGSWREVEQAIDRVLELPESERRGAAERIAPGPVRDGVEDLLAAIGPESIEKSPSRDETVPDSAQALSLSAWALDLSDSLPDDGGSDRGLESERRVRRELVGTWAGGFMIRRRVGRGGMGEVYLADDPQTGQQAAVKVLTSEAPGAAARFEREQHQLAALQHPAIPRLLGTGITDDGRPCFAMEYVRGGPITDFARAHGLGAVERVELFAQLCDAVRYAHAHLVVHRDIKPSNVLASKAPSGTYRVHLLDFGIARPLADRAYATGWGGAGEGPTGEGLRPMTPAYAAPEQALPAGAGREAETTTATDVFALGVVLYELLTERRPLDGGAAPSRVSGLRMERQFARSLDAVVERAIDPSPQARYASADALHADVRRVLAGRAPSGIGLGPVSRGLWFLAQHRVGLVAAALSVVAVVLAFAAADQRWRANLEVSERGRGEVVGAVAEMLRSPSGGDYDEWDLLGRARGVLTSELRGQPAVEADLNLVVADELVRRGDCADALPLYGRAALLRTPSAPDHPVVVAALRGQARCTAGLGGPDMLGLPSADGVRRATRLALEALALAVSRYGEGSAVAASVETDLALYHAYSGERDAASERLRSARSTLNRLRHDWTAEVQRSRDVREGAGSHVPVFPRAENSATVALIASRAEIVRSAVLAAQGKPTMAAEKARETVDALLGADRPAAGASPDARVEVVALGLLTEAHALRQMGNANDAREVAERAAETLARQFGRRDPRALRARTVAATLRGPEAPRLTAALLSEVAADAEDVGDDAALAHALLGHGRALRRAGDQAGAEAAIARVAAMRPADVGPQTLALAFTGLSELALEAGDVEGSLDRSADGLRVARTLPAVGLSRGILLSAATARAASLVAAGREGKAVAVLEPVLRAADSGPSWPALDQDREKARRVLDAARERM